MNPSKSIKTRLLLILVAAIAVVGIAPSGASAAQKIHSDVGLNLQYQAPGTGVAKGFLFGAVTADKKACLNVTIEVAREVNFDPNTWEYGWKSIPVSSPTRPSRSTSRTPIATTSTRSTPASR